MTTNELFLKVNEVALSEIEKFGGPTLIHYNASIRAAEKLSNIYNLDADLVKTGVALMDIKLGECIKTGIQQKHVEISHAYAMELLNQLNIEEQTKAILSNCILAHHGKVNFETKEAEVCANADCYRFLSPEGIINFIQTNTKRGNDHNTTINNVIAKMDEKNDLLSLKEPIEELRPLYITIKEFLLKAKI